MEPIILGFLNDDNSTAKIIHNLHYKSLKCIMQDNFDLGVFIAIFEDAYQKLQNKEDNT